LLTRSASWAGQVLLRKLVLMTSALGFWWPDDRSVDTRSSGLLEPVLLQLCLNFLLGLPGS